MKSKKENKLLTFLNKECQVGKFQIIEKQDMLSCFGANEYIDENELENRLSLLERQGYIKIKYEDENVYCISLLNQETEEKREQQKLSLSVLYIFTFVFAFLGGLIGAIITSLV